MNSNRVLPQKESSVFKNILKHYEVKQYKKGLKLADSILKKFPEHGETLALKGLFLTHLQKKEEGYEFVKKGIRHDLTSHICWHVYGLVHRADKNYEETTKCYLQALKFNKHDIQILNDLALVQTQLRQYDALVSTRTDLLMQRPDNPVYWLGLIVTYQLVKEYDTAIKFLTQYESTFHLEGTKLIQSEILLYHNWLLEEKGDYKGALEHLKSIETKVKDRTAWKEKHALFLRKTGEDVQAETAYRLLISDNPHDSRYVKELLDMKNLGQDERAAYSLLSELYDQYPRSKAIEALILSYATGNSFKVRVTQALQSGLRKGVPSLFRSLKMYYVNPEKENTIDTLITAYAENLEKTGTFDDSGEKESPSTHLWTLYYLAQHQDYHQEYTKALDTIDRAISHTPTVVELYMTKGRILKHAGKLQEAADVMNGARQLDLQDRFINSKCAKYQLRADRMEEAEETVSLFTRSEVPPLQDMIDMQCQWYLYEAGMSHLRQKDYGRALSRFLDIESFFSIIYEDQFDFHRYCLARKTSLRTYVEMLRCEDGVYGQPYFLRAAHGAMTCYMNLADQPTSSNGLRARDENKPNKPAVTKKDETATKTSAEIIAELREPKHTTTPLDDAARLIKPLQQHFPRLVDTHVLSFEVHLRKQKWLLALKCLVKTVELDVTHGTLKANVARFKKAVADAGQLDDCVQKVMDEHLKDLDQSLDAVDKKETAKSSK